MTGRPRAVRETSLSFDPSNSSLTYLRLLRHLIQEVGLLFLRSPARKPGAALSPECQQASQAGELSGSHCNKQQFRQEPRVKYEWVRGWKRGKQWRVTLYFTDRYMHMQNGVQAAVQAWSRAVKNRALLPSHEVYGTGCYSPWQQGWLQQSFSRNILFCFDFGATYSPVKGKAQGKPWRCKTGILCTVMTGMRLWDNDGLSWIHLHASPNLVLHFLPLMQVRLKNKKTSSVNLD